MSQAYTPNIRFIGHWIGETQECEMPAHIWKITLYGDRHLYITTRWENQPQTASFIGLILPHEDAFAIPRAALGDDPDWKAVLVDSQHFIIPGWDTNDVRNDEGPAYDVVFSRPGLAELTAHAVWLKYKESLH